MNEPIFLDTETCGLHGPIVLLQYAIGDGEIELYCPWQRPVNETIDLLEWIAANAGGVVFFNGAFDWFHVFQHWTVLRLLREQGHGNAILGDVIHLYAWSEAAGRDYPLCLKPVKCLDLMLHARKTSYQSTMDRKDVRIRRVPEQLAKPLAAELCERVRLKPIYFARRHDKNAPQWQVFETDDPDFKDVVLKFAPSSALKTLAADALNLPEDDILLFADVELPKHLYPEEKGYKPFGGSWPKVIEHHITHWCYNELARKYAAKDVDLTRRLYQHFGKPALGDDDSELACCVACCRWRGYSVDLDGLRKLLLKTKIAKIHNLCDGKWFDIPTAPNQAAKYIGELLGPMERAAMKGSTDKETLEEMSTWTQPCDCVETEGLNAYTLDEMLAALQWGKGRSDCLQCGGTGKKPHPVVERVNEVTAARAADKERMLYDKLIEAGRFHVSVKVIGTLSGRMAGADGLNPQAINHHKDVRACFPLAQDGYVLCGGDFESFEVTIAEALYNDPDLRKKLLGGKKIHALFGVHVYEGMTYEQILATAGTSNDLYKRCKEAVFASLYMGTAYTLKKRLKVSEEIAAKALANWQREYPGIARSQRRIYQMFGALHQPEGIGTRIYWREPADKVESLLGFPRHFTLENQICRALFDLAQKPPKAWTKLDIKVRRRDREQTAQGACQSALYAAAFAVQGANIRAAGNHQVQSTGAQITKAVQRTIWDCQPSGVHEWLVQPFQVHDEVLSPCHPSVVQKVKEAVNAEVEEYRGTIPLIKLGWVVGLKSWADKQ